MEGIEASVTIKGRVTLPSAIRRRLSPAGGGVIAFKIADDGRIELRAAAYPTIASWCDAAGSLATPYSWHEIRAIAREDHLGGRYGGGECARTEEK